MRPERSLMFWRQLAAMRAESFAAVPDAALLDRYTIDRDEAAFEELARRHGGMVWAVCRQLLPDPADAEDAFQAVFLAFVKSSGRVRNGNVGAWLHGTAVRGAMKLRRGAVRARQRDRATARPEATTPPADWNELLTAVHEEVGRLPEALRTAFVVCDLEGVPQPDAATRLGWKAGTLTGRLSKARKRLLDALTKRGLAPAATLGLLGLSAATTSADVPLKLLVTVLNFPSAAPGTIPAALAALSLEIVPMTLSNVKLLALAVMLTCGLAAGTGTVLVPMADAQGPPAAPPSGLPPAETLKPGPAPKPEAAQPASDVEYLYWPLPVEYGVTPPIDLVASMLRLKRFAEWEFAGTFTSKLSESEYSHYLGSPPRVLANNKPNDHTVMVFKKRRTPDKQSPVTITDSKTGMMLAADALYMGAFVEHPTPKPALCTTAFTVTETPVFGVTVTYTYKPGEVVAPQHLRYAGKNATAPKPTADLPLQAQTRTAPQSQDRLEAQPVPTPSAAPQVKPLALPVPVPLPATPPLTGDESIVICTTGVMITQSDGGKGLNVTRYAVGDVVKPADVSAVTQLGGNVVVVKRSELVKSLGNVAPRAAPLLTLTGVAGATQPPFAEPVVIELKVLSAETVVELCKEVLSKSVKVVALPQTNSVIVIAATTDELKVIEKMLKLIDKPGQTRARTEVDPRPAITRGLVPSVPQPANDSNRLPPDDMPAQRTPRIPPQVSTPGGTRADPLLPLPASRR